MQIKQGVRSVAVGLCLSGLICIPESAPDFVAYKAIFKRARRLIDVQNAESFGRAVMQRIAPAR
jgi:hypothetical protein